MRVHFRETDLQERDEQAEASEESMGDEIDCDFEYTETEPISPADLAAGRDADINRTLRFHKSLPQDALIVICQSSLSRHVVNARQTCGAPQLCDESHCASSWWRG